MQEKESETIRAIIRDTSAFGRSKMILSGYDSKMHGRYVNEGRRRVDDNRKGSIQKVHENGYLGS